MVKISDLSQNKGKIVEENDTKAAVYKDAEGSVKVFSTSCPHLGCDIEWNDTENTWDCPCHGSRFETDGSLKQGPASRGLDPMAFKTENDEIKFL